MRASGRVALSRAPRASFSPLATAYLRALPQGPLLKAPRAVSGLAGHLAEILQSEKAYEAVVAIGHAHHGPRVSVRRADQQGRKYPPFNPPQPYRLSGTLSASHYSRILGLASVRMLIVKPSFSVSAVPIWQLARPISCAGLDGYICASPLA